MRPIRQRRRPDGTTQELSKYASFSVAILLASASGWATWAIYYHYELMGPPNFLGLAAALAIPCFLATSVLAALTPSRRWTAGKFLSGCLVSVAIAIVVLDGLAQAVYGSHGRSFIGSPLAFIGVAVGACAIGLRLTPASGRVSKRLIPVAVVLAACTATIVFGCVFARVRAAQLRHHILAVVTPVVEAKMTPYVFGKRQHIVWERTYVEYDATRFWGRVGNTKAWVCVWVSHHDPRWPIARANQWWRFEQLDFWFPQPALLSESHVSESKMLKSIGVNPAFVRALRNGTNSGWGRSTTEGPIFYGVDHGQNPAYTFGEGGTPINGWYTQVRINRKDQQPMLPMEARPD